MASNDTPSASTLLYLFPEQVMASHKAKGHVAGEPGAPVRHGGALSRSIEVPCAGVKVQRLGLASGLFAIALWQLRNDGLLSLEYQERKRLGMFTRGDVMVTPTGSAPGRGALEGRLLGVMADGRPRLFGDLVYQWLGHVADPPLRVFAAAHQAAVPMGVFTEVDAQRGPVGGFFLGKTKFFAVCDRRDELRSVATETLGRWSQFRTSEQQLAAQIEKSAGKGIGRRVVEANE